MSQIQHQIQNQIVKLQQDLNKLIQLSQNQMPTCSKDYIVETTPTGQEIIRLLDEDELQFIKCEPNEDEIEYNLPVHEEMYYLEQLDANKFIENRQLFECPICFTDINIGAGVVLKNCLHMFCKECLKATIEVSNDIHTKCPYTDYLGSCEFFLQESEVVSFASDEAIKKQHAESLKQAELSAAGTAFHCKHPDCNYWVFLDPELVGKFTCEVCGNRNCLNCKVN